tara:strand:- start:1175 stop:2041 length:867 start_codon:yes stop_codon:yes gene_type:complete
MEEYVFRNFDQKSLDREYNNRGKVTNTDHKILQADASRRAKSIFRTQLDVAYGSGSSEFVDLYLPTGKGPYPIHLFFHGGYWISNKKDDFGFVALPFVEHGVIVVVVDYGLVPSVTMEGLLNHCRSALSWVFKNAQNFGGDVNNVTLSGHSAGAHIVAMLMATDWRALYPEVPEEPIKAGCGVSGVYDLQPVQLSYLNNELGLTPELAEKLSPVLLEPKVHAPFLLPVGGDEGPEYIRQSEDMGAAWRKRGVDCDVWLLPEHNHFDTINQLIDVDSEISEALRAQIFG